MLNVFFLFLGYSKAAGPEHCAKGHARGASVGGLRDNNLIGVVSAAERVESHRIVNRAVLERVGSGNNIAGRQNGLPGSVLDVGSYRPYVTAGDEALEDKDVAGVNRSGRRSHTGNQPSFPTLSECWKYTPRTLKF